MASSADCAAEESPCELCLASRYKLICTGMARKRTHGVSSDRKTKSVEFGHSWPEVGIAFS